MRSLVLLPKVQQSPEPQQGSSTNSLLRDLSRVLEDQLKLLVELTKLREDLLGHRRSPRKLQALREQTVLSIAEVAFELRDFHKALKTYELALSMLSQDDAEQRTKIHFRMGCMLRARGLQQSALYHFEHALQHDSGHLPTLEALVEMYRAAQDWRQVAAYKRQILDNTRATSERVRLLCELIEIWTTKEHNPPKALEALEEALELDPHNRELLNHQLELFQSLAVWHKATDTLKAIAALESEPEMKALYLFTQGQIFLDKIEDLDRALQSFSEALLLNPNFFEAMERIDCCRSAAPTIVMERARSGTHRVHQPVVPRPQPRR